MNADNEISEEDDDTDFDDDTCYCEGCGRDINSYDGEPCPMCCSNDGWYQPGTEECDFCRYSEECMREQYKTLNRRK
jgi:hypothetical protein